MEIIDTKYGFCSTSNRQHHFLYLEVFYQVIIILLSCGLYFSMICKCGMIFNRLLLPPSSLLHPLLQPTTPLGTAEEIAKLLNQITLMKIEESQPLVNLIRYSKDVLMYYNPSFQTHFCTLWDLNQYIIYLLRRVDNTLRFTSRILHCFLIFCMILSSTLT